MNLAVMWIVCLLTYCLLTSLMIQELEAVHAGYSSQSLDWVQLLASVSQFLASASQYSASASASHIDGLVNVHGNTHPPSLLVFPSRIKTHRYIYCFIAFSDAVVCALNVCTSFSLSGYRLLLNLSWVELYYFLSHSVTMYSARVATLVISNTLIFHVTLLSILLLLFWQSLIHHFKQEHV